MSARDEPSYLAFARANVRESLTSSATIVRELVARIDRDASALKASQPRTITTIAELDALPNGVVLIDQWGEKVTRTWDGALHLMFGTATVSDGARYKYLPATVLFEPVAS